jgi:hypothetical protein
MTQTDHALGGSDGSTPRHVVWLGRGGRRWVGMVGTTIVLVLAGGLAWFGWHSTEPTAPRAAGPTAVAVVTGDVVVEGGLTQVSGGSDIQPVRSAPMLVTGFTTSGRRVARRFTADREGHFRLKLLPGRYTVTAVLYQGSIPLAQEPHATVHVRAGQQPHIQILQHAA